jgi:hypothetical protein
MSNERTMTNQEILEAARRQQLPELYPDEPAPDTNQTDTEIDTDISDSEPEEVVEEAPEPATDTDRNGVNQRRRVEERNRTHIREIRQQLNESEPPLEYFQAIQDEQRPSGLSGDAQDSRQAIKQSYQEDLSEEREAVKTDYQQQLDEMDAAVEQAREAQEEQAAQEEEPLTYGTSGSPRIQDITDVEEERQEDVIDERTAGAELEQPLEETEQPLSEEQVAAEEQEVAEEAQENIEGAGLLTMPGEEVAIVQTEQADRFVLGLDRAEVGVLSQEQEVTAAYLADLRAMADRQSDERYDWGTGVLPIDRQAHEFGTMDFGSIGGVVSWYDSRFSETNPEASFRSRPFIPPTDLVLAIPEAFNLEDWNNISRSLEGGVLSDRGYVAMLAARSVAYGVPVPFIGSIESETNPTGRHGDNYRIVQALNEGGYSVSDLVVAESDLLSERFVDWYNWAAGLPIYQVHGQGDNAVAELRSPLNTADLGQGRTAESAARAEGQRALNSLYQQRQNLWTEAGGWYVTIDPTSARFAQLAAQGRISEGPIEDYPNAMRRDPRLINEELPTGHYFVLDEFGNRVPLHNSLPWQRNPDIYRMPQGFLESLTDLGTDAWRAMNMLMNPGYAEEIPLSLARDMLQIPGFDVIDPDNRFGVDAEGKFTLDRPLSTTLLAAAHELGVQTIPMMFTRASADNEALANVALSPEELSNLSVAPREVLETQVGETTVAGPQSMQQRTALQIQSQLEQLEIQISEATFGLEAEISAISDDMARRSLELLTTSTEDETTPGQEPQAESPVTAIYTPLESQVLFQGVDDEGNTTSLSLTPQRLQQWQEVTNLTLQDVEAYQTAFNQLKEAGTVSLEDPTSGEFLSAMLEITNESGLDLTAQDILAIAFLHNRERRNTNAIFETATGQDGQVTTSSSPVESIENEVLQLEEELEDATSRFTDQTLTTTERTDARVEIRTISQELAQARRQQDAIDAQLGIERQEREEAEAQAEEAEERATSQQIVRDRLDEEVLDRLVIGVRMAETLTSLEAVDESRAEDIREARSLVLQERQNLEMIREELVGTGRQSFRWTERRRGYGTFADTYTFRATFNRQDSPEQVLEKINEALTGGGLEGAASYYAGTTTYDDLPESAQALFSGYTWNDTIDAWVPDDEDLGLIVGLYSDIVAELERLETELGETRGAFRAARREEAPERREKIRLLKALEARRRAMIPRLPPEIESEE